MSTDAFQLFGEVGVDLSSFDKSMDAADARLKATSQTMGQTGTASDRMAARINAASQSLAKMRDDASRAEAEAKKLGTVTKEDAEHFTKLNAALDKAEQALARTQQEFNKTGEATKTASGHVLNLENRVKACDRALRGESGALKESGDAADLASRKHASLADRVGKIAGGMQAVGVALSASITAPLLGVGTMAVKTASDVQSAVANIATIKPEIDTSGLYKQLNDLQTKVPYTASQLGEALYDIVGTIDVDQNGGVKLLEKFSQGATAARTDAQTFGSAMMGMMGAFGKSVGDADSVMDIFFNTVNRASNLTGSQLAPELGKVSAMASKAGVSMEEMGALIVASSKGGGVASENINNVANMLQKLPMPEARKQLKALGVDLVDAGGKFRPILTVLAELKNKMKGMSEGDKSTTLSRIFPDAQALVGISTVMKFLDDADKALDENRSHTDSTAKAWSLMSATMTVQATLLKNSILNALGQIGERLVPILAPVVSWLAEKIPSATAFILKAFQSLPSSVQGAAAAFTAAVGIMGPVMAALGVVIAGVAAIGLPVAAVLVGIVAEIALFAAQAGAAAVLIYNAWQENFGGLRSFTLGVWATLKAGLSEFVSYFQNLWGTYGEDIKSTFFEAWESIVSFLAPKLREMLAVVSVVWGAIVSVTKAVWPIIKTIVEGVLQTVLAIIRTGTAILNSNWSRAWEQFKQIALKSHEAMAEVTRLILSALAYLATQAYQAAIGVGKRIVAGLVSGITGNNASGQIASAMFGLIIGAGSSAQSVAAQQGAAAGNAYKSALAAAMGGGGGAVAGSVLNGGGGTISSLFGMGGGGQKSAQASAGPWAAGVMPGKDFSKPKDTKTPLPPAGPGGHKGSGGGGGNNSEANAEIKLAELNLKIAERVYREGSAQIKSLYDFRKVSMAQMVTGEIALEEKLLAQKLAVIAKERTAAEKLKGPERLVKLKELDEKGKDAESQTAEIIARKRDDLAKMNEEKERGRQETLFQILQNGERAKLAEVQSAGNMRVSSAESIAKRVAEIEQEQLDNEEAYLKRQLIDAGQNEKAIAEIKNKLALLEVQRGHVADESNRTIAEARKKDLDDYRSYSQRLAELANTNISTQIDLERMRLDHLGIFSTNKGKLLKEEIRIDMEAEDLRHKQAFEAIEKERYEFMQMKHTRAEYEEFLKQYHNRVEGEEAQHAAQTTAIQDKQTKALQDKLKKIADSAGDILGRAIDAGVKGGFGDAFRSVAKDFAALLRDLGMQLLKAEFLHLLQRVLKIQVPSTQGSGSATTTAGASSGGGLWDSIKSVVGSIFGGGTNNGSNSTPKDPTTDAVNTQGDRQVDATKGGTGATTDEVKTQGDQSNGKLGGILGTNQNMLGALNSLAAGIRSPGWATALKIGLTVAQSALASKSKSGESGGGTAHAAGGYISGAGTGTSDSIRAFLSNGEYVINAASVRRHGRSYFDSINFGGRAPIKFASGGYVGGGSAQSIAAVNRSSSGDTHVHIGPITINGGSGVPQSNQSAQQMLRDTFGQALRAHQRLA